MIEAGAAGVHFEDQLAAEKKCGHLGGKVLVPTSQFIRTLNAARLAADVLDVPTVLVARTDALPRDPPDERRRRVRPRVRHRRAHGGRLLPRRATASSSAIARALAYAPYADLLWCETSTPDLGEARAVRRRDPREVPRKLLAYNCSPSFNWKLASRRRADRRLPAELAAMGYRFQFITLAGFHPSTPRCSTSPRLRARTT